MEEDITLQQGLAKFNMKNQAYFSDRGISDDGEEFLKCHDVAHVVFGCDTTIYGEGLVKIWTTFGTTLTFWKVVSGYNEASAFELAKMYSFGHILKNIFRFLRVIPKAILRTRKMTKPWPFLNYKDYLNKSLVDIRKEFNIQIIN